jgi:orotate phosphoribosyltransferase
MIAKILLKREAVLLRPKEPFTFASGIKSPIYCDNRLLLSFPEDRKTIVNALAELAKTFHPKQIAGVATAGIAWGALLADQLKLPFAYIRAKAKEHGKKNLIEGKLDPKAPTLVVEDLVSTAGSVISAIEALQQETISIAGAVSIFSYGFKESDDVFKTKSCRFHPVVTLDDLLKSAIDLKKITESEKTMIEAWRANPREHK